MALENPGLQEEIEKAIDKWLADYGGGMIKASITVIDFFDKDGEQSWAFSTAPGQQLVTTMGLVQWMKGLTEYEQFRYHQESEGT